MYFYTYIMLFEWDKDKDIENQRKHHISFEQARLAFVDPRRLIIEDFDHSSHEKRWFCLGTVDGGVMPVRFAHRNRKIRIFGAGYWRKGKIRYEKENKIHR